ncbi:hypothetical protein [Sphingobium ummariense]
MKGDVPAQKIKLDRIAATVAASNSFKAVADEWLKVEREGRSGVTMKKLRWLLAFINASLGSGLVDQKGEMVVAARAIAEKKAVWHRVGGWARPSRSWAVKGFDDMAVVQALQDLNAGRSVMTGNEEAGTGRRGGGGVGDDPARRLPAG